MSRYGYIEKYLNTDAVERRLAALQKKIEGAILEDKSQPESLSDFAWRSWRMPEEERAEGYQKAKAKAIEEKVEAVRKFKTTATCQDCGLTFPYFTRIDTEICVLEKPPIYCLPCHRKRCDQEARQERIDNFRERNPLSRHYLSQNGSPPRPAQFDAVQNWREWWDDGDQHSQGLVLVGDSFTGKTTAVYRLVRKLVEENDYESFLAVNSTQLNAIPERVMDRTISTFMQELQEVELLLIDDLDKVRITPRVASELWGLFEHRLREQNLSVFITMNTRTKRDFIRLFNGKDADSRQIGLSIYNRLQQACQFIDFDVLTQPANPPTAGEEGAGEEPG